MKNNKVQVFVGSEAVVEDVKKTVVAQVDDFMKSVKRPFGILLSGGIDSGLLAALTKPDFVYSLRFEYGEKYDESGYAEMIIDHLGLRNKTKVISFTEEMFKEEFNNAVKAMGEPVSHFSLTPLHYVFKKIREDYGVGARILSGEGPDEYLGGYARYIIYDNFNKLYNTPELKNYERTLNRALGTSGQHDIFNTYLKSMGYNKSLKNIRSIIDISQDYLSGKYPLVGAMGKLDMECGTIEHMEQVLATHHGVELLYPYISDRFSEYCYRLPDSVKIAIGHTKLIWRKIAQEFLPDVIVTRNKMGGPVAPVGVWLGQTKNEFSKDKYIKLQREILNDPGK